jgi:hypothetical protein
MRVLLHLLLRFEAESIDPGFANESAVAPAGCINGGILIGGGMTKYLKKIV